MGGHDGIACRLLDDATCLCAQYDIRRQFVPECIALTPQTIEQNAYWLPQSCAYKRLWQGDPLPDWHPLITGDPETVHDQIILDVENAKTTRNQKMRETLLEKALRALNEYEEPEYKLDPKKDLVEEEITEEKKKFHLRIIRERKERVLICTEMAKLAYEEELTLLAEESASLAVKEEWDVTKDKDLIIA